MLGYCEAIKQYIDDNGDIHLRTSKPQEQAQLTHIAAKNH